MKLVLDMNLSPEWVPFLHERGVEAVHWSSVGNPRAPDAEIMQWARDNEAVVFTHDLDFGILLAHTNAGRPSVIQVRTQDVSPRHLGKTIATVLEVIARLWKQGRLSRWMRPKRESGFCPSRPISETHNLAETPVFRL